MGRPDVLREFPAEVPEPAGFFLVAGSGKLVDWGRKTSEAGCPTLSYRLARSVIHAGGAWSAMHQ